MNEPQSIYAKGYLLYKGFGCKQNYIEAVQCFRKGAFHHLANSMYFLGLCFRNGYGINKNKDSAMYWLQKSFMNGEKMAIQELKTNEPENNNPKLTEFANDLKLKTLKSKNGTINKVEKINNSIEANIIEGNYRGYIIKYDWSNPLQIELNYQSNSLVGTWLEENNESTPFYAKLTSNTMLFNNTSYKTKSHYNPTVALKYNFQNANIQWQNINDSMTLSGTIQMFNENINEPNNNQFIYLTKYKNTLNTNLIEVFNDDGTVMKTISNLTVSPNPFNKIIKVEFKNNETQNVSISLHSINGNQVYNNNLGVLSQGFYSIDLLPNQMLTPGIYILKVVFNNKAKFIKIIKQ
jgi:uncharacterized protein